ncbi:MAG: sugar phosphate isomerase/epimerase [Saprospiraceae bacterium]|nr:sugar phosphate isomerase/epimerase [Saprospiraceae bacterium]
MKNEENRRNFIKRTSLLAAGIGISSTGMGSQPEAAEGQIKSVPSGGPLPENPLILFDNFHSGNIGSYSWQAKFAAAQHAGFDGYEFAVVDPKSDRWKEAMDLVPTTDFKVWGFHWTTKAVIDQHADKINQEIEKIIDTVEICGNLSIKPYYTLSLSGTGELGGPTFSERGSAKAKDRHWERAFKIIEAFDKACRENGLVGSLYPHIDWICDTPQSAFKILQGAKADTVVPAFCSHHWYANEASLDLDQMLDHPMMQRLSYVVLTNGMFTDSSFRAVRFNEGQIDMAWILAKLYRFGYTGPISSQGWKIGGDPYFACKQFVAGVKAIRKRYIDHPELNPLP